jgi:hypothetical protein
MSPGRGSWWSEKVKNAPATGKRFENHKGMLGKNISFAKMRAWGLFRLFP